MRHLTLVWAVLALSCGSSNPSANPVAYCTELATRFCDQQISCGKFASSHRKECIESVRVNQCGARPAESSRGLLKLNEKLVTRCLADIKTTGCTREGNYLNNSCYAAIEPAVDTGGACETDSHCRTVGDRCIGIGCERKCQAAGGAGQPCRPTGFGTGSCNFGLTCDGSGQCSRGGATGADCGGGIPCDPDNYCDNATDKCVALPAAGQPCRFGAAQCVEAAYCALTTCEARLQPTASCLSTSQCVVGNTCRGGTCQPLAAEGAACTGSADCAAGLSCDNVALTCQKVKRAFFEEACSSTASCHGSLTCRNLRPARGGTAGTAGTCGIGAAGDSCFTSSGCPPATFCPPPATVGDPSTCTASTAGTDCSADDDCSENDACHRADRKCVARVAAGGNCAEIACVATTSCIRRGTAMVCVELADLAETCTVDMVLATPCQAPLVCGGNTCISAGRKGEACLGSAVSGVCFAGACMDGVCGELRPDGASCRQDTDCFTGACDRQICVQQCR